ncbi:cytochrome P450 [Aspergillus spectabilis]
MLPDSDRDSQLAVALVGRLLYNIYFYLLWKYPGPRLWAASRIPWIWASTRGRVHRELQILHAKHEPIVRIAPNKLSYTTRSAWRTIYGHQSVEMMKDLRGAGLLPTFKGTDSIVTAQRADHARMRRTVAHAFSEKALREQEHIYNFTTFNIMGDLSFGEPFGYLQEGQYHEWAAVYYGLTNLRVLFLPKKLVEAKENADATAYEKVACRLGRKDLDRKDFISYILRHNDERGLTLPEIQETAVVLIIAGSKQQPLSLRLIAEIRDKFRTYEEITIIATQDMKYLLAVVDEAFRVYAPSTNAFPRVVPKGGVEIDGQWVPGDMTLHDEHDVPAEHFVNDNKSVVQLFSFGPRACLGKSIAYAELRLIICKLLWSFDLQLASEVANDSWAEKQDTYILWEKGPLMVQLAPVCR